MGKTFANTENNYLIKKVKLQSIELDKRIVAILLKEPDYLFWVK